MNYIDLRIKHWCGFINISSVDLPMQRGQEALWPTAPSCLSQKRHTTRKLHIPVPQYNRLIISYLCFASIAYTNTMPVLYKCDMTDCRRKQCVNTEVLIYRKMWRTRISSKWFPAADVRFLTRTNCWQFRRAQFQLWPTTGDDHHNPKYVYDISKTFTNSLKILCFKIMTNWKKYEQVITITTIICSK